jgi:dienelactone hydrolase
MSRFVPVVWLSFAVWAALSGRLWGQTDYRVLPADFNSDKAQQMMRAYQRKQVQLALDKRIEELEAAIASPDDVLKYQVRRREFLSWSLGVMPERAPLNARQLGVLAEEGFTIEKVLFESQPGFHVTANLYRPDGPGPFPAILHPVGHSENGKAFEAYQQANRLLVRHGFIVLCFDPIGQGERKQLVHPDGSVEVRGSGEHQRLGAAPILLGRSLGSYMVWDAVRALDYLCGRADVDVTRIGCTGNSGGGNMTSYMMAYDDRIAAAAPGCFMTTHRLKNESPGPGDAEQNLYAQIGQGFDHADFILVRAPKPTLILAATDDYVPIEGAWEAFRQAKRVYTALGYPERVDLIETKAKHGFSPQLREGVVRFFCRWLKGEDLDELAESSFKEPSLKIRSDQELQVTPTGQVTALDGARPITELYEEFETHLASQRSAVTGETVRQIAGIRELDELPIPRIEVLAGETEGASPQKMVFYPEPGIMLPALYWPHGENPPVLLTPEQGMNSVVEQAEVFHARGHPVLIVELRDSGETKTRQWRFAGADFYIGYMLGRNWLGMRTEDILTVGRWMSQRHHDRSITLVADGEMCPAALHAAALEQELISDLKIQNGLDSWRPIMTSWNASAHLHNVVPGALRYYDLADLRQMLAH